MSRGLTGKTFQRFGKETEDDIITYDCVPDLVKLIGRTGREFSRVVCATWSTEKSDQLQAVAEALEPECLLTLEDKTVDLPVSRSMTPKNNHYRQFYSTLKGVERLMEFGCDWVVKVRTDQMADYSVLKSFFSARPLANVERLVVPYFLRGAPPFLMDFYLAGRAELLKILCEGYLSRGVVYQSIHQDIFFQWAELMGLARGPVPLRAMMIFEGTEIERKYSRRAWHDCFEPGPRSIMESLEWRGEKFPKPLEPRFLFAEDCIDGRIPDEELEPTKSILSIVPSRIAMAGLRGLWPSAANALRSRQLR